MSPGAESPDGTLGFVSMEYFVERLHEGKPIGLFRQCRESHGCSDKQYDFTAGRWVEDETGAVASFTFRAEPSGERINEGEALELIRTGIKQSPSANS